MPPPTQAHDAKQAYWLYEAARKEMKRAATKAESDEIALEHARKLHNLIPKADRDIPEPE